MSKEIELKLAVVNEQRKLADASYGGNICFGSSLGSFPCSCAKHLEERSSFATKLTHIFNFPEDIQNKFWEEVRNITESPVREYNNLPWYKRWFTKPKETLPEGLVISYLLEQEPYKTV